MNHKVTLLEDDDYDLDDDLPAELDLARLRVVRRGPKTKPVTVTLAPDVAEFFKSPEAVNAALRRVMQEMQTAA